MNYNITYKVKNSRGQVIKSGTYKVKNADNPAIAQMKLEKFFRKKFPDFYIMEVSTVEGSDPTVDHLKSIFGMN